MDKNKNLYNEIAKVAYDLYEKRGKAQGYEVEDWIKAERIVMKRHAQEIEDEAKAIKSTKKTKTVEKTKSKSFDRTF